MNTLALLSVAMTVFASTNLDDLVVLTALGLWILADARVLLR